MGEDGEEGGPGQTSPPQDDERMGEQERGELGEADGAHHAHIQAHEEQREEVAHFLHHSQDLQREVTGRVRQTQKYYK